jgi:hypothetical protein
VRRANLTGAYGIAPAVPAAAIRNHPDRVMHYTRLLWLAWAVRLGLVGALLCVLYLTHVI